MTKKWSDRAEETHRFELAHEGLAAVEAARTYQPDVVVLDIGLPDIDGCEVAGRLRQEPGFDQMLLIALTGYGQEEDRQPCYSAGFDEHLVKPVDPSSLEALLSKADSERQAALKKLPEQVGEIVAQQVHVRCV